MEFSYEQYFNAIYIIQSLDRGALTATSQTLSYECSAHSRRIRSVNIQDLDLQIRHVLLCGTCLAF